MKWHGQEPMHTHNGKNYGYDAPMPKLSISMIVKNESATLGHCLASVQGLADEIVVVDTGSTDNTVEIARSFGAKLGNYTWNDDFASARNASLAMCSCDWVLVLDADEAIDSMDHGLIHQTIAKEKHKAFRLTIRDYFTSGNHSTVGVPATLNRTKYNEGRNFSHYSDFQGLRLCRRLPSLQFEGRIHELLDPFFEKKGLPVGNLPAVVHHYGKVFKDREAFKQGYYLELAKAEALRNPDTLQGNFNLVIQAMFAQEWQTLLDAAERCYALKLKIPIVVALGKAIALHQLGHPKEAIPVLKTVLAADPHHAIALLRMGVALAASGDWEGAREYINKAMISQPTFSPSYINMSELEEKQGNQDAARAVLQKGLNLCPSDPSLLERLVKLSIARNDMTQAAIDANQALLACPTGGNGLWHRLVALQMINIGQAEHALAILNLGLKQYSEDQDLKRLRDSLVQE